MKLLRGHEYQNWKEVTKAKKLVQDKLDTQLEIEQYRTDMLDILQELLEMKDELIGKLRSEIAELKA